MQDIYISIGQNIRRRRKEKHLTQESLAANVETSAQYISRIERGQVCPSLPVSPLVTTTTHVKSVVFLAQPKLIAPLFFMKKGYSEHILKFLVLPPPIMDTHMSFLVQLISNPVPLTS